MLIGDFYTAIAPAQAKYPTFCQSRQELNTWFNALKSFGTNDVNKAFQICLESSNFAPKLKDVVFNAKFYGKKTKLKYEAIELFATYEAVMQDTPQDFKKWLTYLKPEYIELLIQFGIDLETGERKAWKE